MNPKTFVAVAAIFLAMASRADEILPVLKANQQVYTNATILKVTATDIYFVSAQGAGNAKLKDLSPDLQKHFHYNAANAAAVEQQQAAADEQYRSQAANRPKAHPPDETRYPSPPSAGNASELNWGVDLPTALNAARSQNKMVLLDFTGSDWCPWCIKFNDEVLTTGKFASYAGQKLELVEIDFPNAKAQSDALKRDNAELKRRFNVSGFPTYVLLNADGKEIGRQVGYHPGGPDAFIAELEKFAKK
jgi:thioredoxin-related protein